MIISKSELITKRNFLLIEADFNITSNNNAAYRAPKASKISVQ